MALGSFIVVVIVLIVVSIIVNILSSLKISNYTKAVNRLESNPDDAANKKESEVKPQEKKKDSDSSVLPGTDSRAFVTTTPAPHPLPGVRTGDDSRDSRPGTEPEPQRQVTRPIPISKAETREPQIPKKEATQAGPGVSDRPVKPKEAIITSGPVNVAPVAPKTKKSFKELSEQEKELLKSVFDENQESATAAPQPPKEQTTLESLEKSEREALNDIMEAISSAPDSEKSDLANTPASIEINPFESAQQPMDFNKFRTAISILGPGDKYNIDFLGIQFLVENEYAILNEIIAEAQKKGVELCVKNVADNLKKDLSLNCPHLRTV